jgi:hypothetical protein
VSDRPPPAPEVGAPAEPTPKKKKKTPDGEDAAPPRSAALEPLIAAFDAGNYALVRKDGARLLKTSDDDAERAAARDLLRRIEPDPIAKWMMGGAGLLLATLAGWYWMHAHGGP